MPIDYTVDAFIPSVLARSYENTSGLTPTDILRLVNEEVGNYLLPYIQAARNDYFTTHADTALVASVSAYDVPQAANAAELRLIALVDASGNIVKNLVPMEMETLASGGPQSGGLPSAYYFEGNQIQLWPPLNASTPSGYSIRMWYYRRPSELIYGKTSTSPATTAGAIQITSLTPGGGFYTVGFSGAVPAYFVNGASVDLVKGRPGFDIVQTATIQAPGASSVVVVGTQPTNLSVGDWLCPRDQAPVFTGIPAEILTGPFAHWLVVKMMEARADAGAFDRALKTLAASEQRCLQYLRRRNTGAIQQLTASPFRFKGYGGMRRFF